MHTHMRSRRSACEHCAYWHWNSEQTTPCVCGVCVCGVQQRNSQYLCTPGAGVRCAGVRAWRMMHEALAGQQSAGAGASEKRFSHSDAGQYETTGNVVANDDDDDDASTTRLCGCVSEYIDTLTLSGVCVCRLYVCIILHYNTNTVSPPICRACTCTADASAQQAHNTAYTHNHIARARFHGRTLHARHDLGTHTHTHSLCVGCGQTLESA